MAVVTLVPAGAARVVEHNALVFKRMWRGSMTVSFFTPLFFIASMGLGLGSLVNKSSGGVGGVPYIDFLAPGLLAATLADHRVQCTYPILTGKSCGIIYDAMLKALHWWSRRGDWRGGMGHHPHVHGRHDLLGLSAVFGVPHTAESLLAIPAATLAVSPCHAADRASATQKNDSVMGTVFGW
jgi:hypothetical protein